MYQAIIARRSTFVNYACSNFSYHLRQSYAGDARRFIDLCNFLSHNVCSWIEHLARTSNLQKLISTAENLMGFLQARAKHPPRIEEGFQYIDRWGADLVRLASQYGRFLTQNPSAIFWVIPPFCPSASAIANLYNRGNSGLSPLVSKQGIAVNGLSATSGVIAFPVSATKTCAHELLQLQRRISQSRFQINQSRYALWEHVKKNYKSKGGRPQSILKLALGENISCCNNPLS
jgi:hypothetical protein